MESKKTIAVSAEVHQRIKIIAAQENTSMEMVIEHLVHKQLGTEDVSR